MSDEPDRVRRIRNEREAILRKGESERANIRGNLPSRDSAVVTVTKTDRFKAGLSRIKEGAQRVGHEAKEQVSNPESGTRKVASEFKRGARKVANTKTFKRVSANSVDLVRGTDNGLLNVHSEQRSRSKNSHMSNMFSQGIGEPIHPLAGIGPGGVGSNFSIFGEGRRISQPRASGKSKRRKEVITINGKTYSRKIRNRKHRSKHKRKPAQSTWSPF